LELKELNEFLLDKNHNLLLRLIKQCKVKKISVDVETMTLVCEVRRTLGMIHNFSPTFKHPNTTP
jgi:hypothetical protein